MGCSVEIDETPGFGFHQDNGVGGLAEHGRHELLAFPAHCRHIPSIRHIHNTLNDGLQQNAFFLEKGPAVFQWSIVTICNGNSNGFTLLRGPFLHLHPRRLGKVRCAVLPVIIIEPHDRDLRILPAGADSIRHLLELWPDRGFQIFRQGEDIVQTSLLLDPLGQLVLIPAAERDIPCNTQAAKQQSVAVIHGGHDDFKQTPIAIVGKIQPSFPEHGIPIQCGLVFVTEKIRSLAAKQLVDGFADDACFRFTTKAFKNRVARQINPVRIRGPHHIWNRLEQTAEFCPLFFQRQFCILAPGNFIDGRHDSGLAFIFHDRC